MREVELDQIVSEQIVGAIGDVVQPRKGLLQTFPCTREKQKDWSKSPLIPAKARMRRSLTETSRSTDRQRDNRPRFSSREWVKSTKSRFRLRLSDQNEWVSILPFPVDSTVPNQPWSPKIHTDTGQLGFRER